MIFLVIADKLYRCGFCKTPLLYWNKFKPNNGINTSGIIPPSWYYFGTTFVPKLKDIESSFYSWLIILNRFFIEIKRDEWSYCSPIRNTTVAMVETSFSDWKIGAKLFPA